MTYSDFLKFVYTERVETEKAGGGTVTVFNSKCLLRGCDEDFDSTVHDGDVAEAKRSSISKVKMHMINDHGIVVTEDATDA